MSRYFGKVALITGGSQGLGKAFASDLLKRGAKVSLVDIDQRHGVKSEKEFRAQHGDDKALFVQCDVSKKDQLEHAFKETKDRFGRLDIVINNAGIADEVNWEKTIAIDLNAVIHGTYLGIKEMRQDTNGQGGIIINISSLAGMVAVPVAPAYTAAKHGVVGFTRSLAQSVSVDTYGIRLCCLCPSFTDTAILNDIDSQMKGLPEEWMPAKKAFSAGIKSLGLMKPEDVVKALVTLIEDERNHGGVLTVTPAGLEYKAPKHLKGKL